MRGKVHNSQLKRLLIKKMARLSPGLRVHPHKVLRALVHYRGDLNIGIRFFWLPLLIFSRKDWNMFAQRFSRIMPLLTEQSPLTEGFFRTRVVNQESSTLLLQLLFRRGDPDIYIYIYVYLHTFHPPSSPLTHNISQTVLYLYTTPPFPFIPINDVHLPTRHPPFPVQ